MAIKLASQLSNEEFNLTFLPAICAAKAMLSIRLTVPSSCFERVIVAAVKAPSLHASFTLVEELSKNILMLLLFEKS